MMLDPWPTSWRPRWWYDEALRSFVLNARGRMTITDCASEGRARFGRRFPSKSTVHRMWARLRTIEERNDDPMLHMIRTLDDRERLELAEALIGCIRDPGCFVHVAALSRRASEHALCLARKSFEQEGESL